MTINGPFLMASAVVSFGSTLAVLTLTGAIGAPPARSCSASAIAAAVCSGSSRRPSVAGATPTMRPPRVLRYLAETGVFLTALATFPSDFVMAASSTVGQDDPSGPDLDVDPAAHRRRLDLPLLLAERDDDRLHHPLGGRADGERLRHALRRVASSSPSRRPRSRPAHRSAAASPGRRRPRRSRRRTGPGTLA